MSSSWMRRAMGVGIAFAAFLTCLPVFAQTGGLTGKCTSEDGKPLAGYTILVERQEIKWSSHVKTNKKGEYVYIGLAPGDYKVTLQDPSGKTVYFIKDHVGIGDPKQMDFDMSKLIAQEKKDQQSNPEFQRQQAEVQKEQKQFTGLKQLFDQGQTLYAQGQYMAAASQFEQALPMAKEKNLPVVLMRLGDTYTKVAEADTTPDARKEHQTKALDDYQKAIQLLPGDPGLHNNLGGLYAAMGKVPEATAEYQKAAELNPTGASGYYYNLGVILVNQNKMDEAAGELKKATDADPKNSNAWYWYGMALLGKAVVKPDGSMAPAPGTVEAFQTYLQLDPNGKWAQAAQDSLNTLQGKAQLEYKAEKKKK